MHVAKFHIHGILKYLGIEEPFNPIDILPRFDFPQKNIILIHPGSGSQKKNYSPEFYLELAKFAETHLKKDVKFILGPVELEKGMNSFFPSDKMLSPRNASDLADILAGAFLFIGNDSGVGHLAGFLGIPTIALYRNTDPEIWGVVGRRVKWLDDAGETALLKKIKKFFFTVNNFEFFMSN
jgi:ADP-heptose:LPS heptosyltransferase